MFSLISRFTDPNQRKISSLQKVIDQISGFESEFVGKTDQELFDSSHNLRQKVQHDLSLTEFNSAEYPLRAREILDQYLPEAFGLVREVFRRVLGEFSYEEQLMVGVLLHRGFAAEQKTGEGKTHAAVHPLFLNAMTGRGAHLVTVNDYLARRDAEWMGLVYNRLGLSVGCINTNSVSYCFDSAALERLSDQLDTPEKVRAFAFGHGELLREVSRKEAYAADVTYGTNNEFGFDYLRDNMVHQLNQLVQVNVRGEVGVHHFAIVDEVDSILIDEARTPLIISAPAEESNILYQKFAGLVKRLNTEDYELDEKTKGAFLTDLGVKKIEQWVGVSNIYEDFELTHHLEQALKAQFAYNKDTDYVIQEDNVLIVDEFTGRLMEGRRYSEGLHQAIEAKEGVTIQKESKTVATITFQNYFRLYEKLAGMSATIMTESEEFFKIYKLDSVSVPTHQLVARVDAPDRIYKNQSAKWKAIVDEIEAINKTGQPILVGTTSVENNELVSQLLRRRGVSHEVLNAKNHQREAEIVSHAGHKGSVTVATNMAGRGTDIRLGQGVKEVGGLHVVGTERHEARRIDNQLRGRAGRQGDPGSSRFYVALDDNLMRIFNGERIAALMERFKLPDDMPIENQIVSRSIESAQQKVEGYNFDIRKHLVEYDDVINRQREIIYRRRRRLLDLGDINVDTGGVDLEAEILNKSIEQLGDESEFAGDLKVKKELVGKEKLEEILKFIFLTTIDHLWMEHIDAVDELRAGIGLRGYGQREPLVEFKNEAYSMFERLVKDIDFEIVNRFQKLKIQTPEGVEIRSSGVLSNARAQHQQTKQFAGAAVRGEAVESAQAAQVPYEKPAELKNISRNDPCLCGSGKKWKQCGLKNTVEHQDNLIKIQRKS